MSATGQRLNCGWRLLLGSPPAVELAVIAAGGNCHVKETDMTAPSASTVLSAEQLAALRALDTPTVCNAIESFKVRGRVEGFCGMDVRCLSPQLGVMLGYAVTLTVDSTTPGVPSDQQVWRAWMRAMADSPQPVVLVLQDVGPQPR